MGIDYHIALHSTNIHTIVAYFYHCHKQGHQQSWAVFGWSWNVRLDSALSIAIFP